MDRGSRMSNLFQTLEKYQGQTKFNNDELLQLKYATSKIHHYVSSQDKTYRDMTLKNSANLDLVLTTLDCCPDAAIRLSIINTLLEILSKSGGKPAATLVSHGATHILFRVLVSQQRHHEATEESQQLVHQVLAKLGAKDRKFGVKARLTQAVSITLELTKTHCTNQRILPFLLQVLKLYSSNAVNASYLGKNGLITLIFKIITTSSRRNTAVIKTSLDTLVLLVKRKSNAARVVGQGGVQILIKMFFEWHRLDNKNNHVALRKAIVSVLKYVTNLKSARKALLDADGVRTLYVCCQEADDQPELEPLSLQASLIMRKCFPRNKLPLVSVNSPLTFNLAGAPPSLYSKSSSDSLSLSDQNDTATLGYNNDIIRSSSGHKNQINRSNEDVQIRRSRHQNQVSNLYQEKHSSEVFNQALRSSLEGNDHSRSLTMSETNGFAGTYDKATTSCNGNGVITDQAELTMSGTGKEVIRSLTYVDESSSGDDDDDLSTDDNLNPEKVNSEDEEEVCGPLSANRRTWEDLSSYKRFFPEMFEFQVHEDEDFTTSEESNVLASSGQKRITSGVWNPYRGKTNLSRSGGAKLLSAELVTSTFQSLSIVAIGSSSKTEQISNFSDLLEVNSLTKTKSQTPQNRCLGRTSSQEQRGKQDLSSNCSHKGHGDTNTAKSYTESYADFSGSLDSGDSDFDIDSNVVSAETYAAIARETRGVGRFNKLTYPDMYGSLPPPDDEPLHDKKFGINRQKIFEDIERYINADLLVDRVVYDLDAIIANSGQTYTHEYSTLVNDDQDRVGQADSSADHLQFNSQFECGNLRKVIQVRENEYDLILNPDINTNHHHQWFYFQVSNIKACHTYRFNIVNCEKINSQFNFGMRPVMFSVQEAMLGQPYWRRVGSEITYYKNHFSRSSKVTGGVKGKSYFTMTFTLTFKHEKDICYIAYHYPYSYTSIKAHLYRWERSHNKDKIYFRNQTLCESASGNTVPVLTITSYPKTYDRQGIQDFKKKRYIFLSSRVHPGESNASWVMHGTLDFLLGDAPAAHTLRDMYIFKIVPVLNPDGVINGNHRCSLSGEDLNRCWISPDARVQPTIYHCKGLLQFMAAAGITPLVYCDYHGHSRKKNVFLYGCNPKDSWIPEDMDNPASTGNQMNDRAFRTLPELLHQSAPAFSLENCSFTVEKSKETTARVVVWRQIGVVQSYTMESTYCGCDQGPYRGLHISTRELEQMGRNFCEALLKLNTRRVVRLDTVLKEPSSSSSISSTHSDDPTWLSGSRAAGAGTPVGEDEAVGVDDDDNQAEEENDGDNDKDMDDINTELSEDEV